jgi:hypothetical protein
MVEDDGLDRRGFWVSLRRTSAWCRIQ